MSRIRSFKYKTKKQKEADRFAKKMIGGAFKLGAIAAKEISKPSNSKKKEIFTQPTPTPQKLSAGCGWGILVMFAIFISLVLLLKNENLGLFLGFILPFFISGFFGVIVMFFVDVSPKNNNNSMKVVNKSNILTDEEHKKIDDITSLILADNPFEDVKNVFENEIINLKILQRSFENAVDSFLEDDLLSEKEEQRINEFIKYFNLSQSDLDSKGTYQRVVMASVLRSVSNGIIPENKFKVSDSIIPFNLNKNEKMIWIFQGVDYFEDTIRRKYQGGSSGFSVKVTNGLYYRTGAFKGNTIETKELKYIGKGFLGVTDKHLYFYSLNKSFRVSYSKIVTIFPSESRLCIHKDGVTAKPQVFSNVDSWFIFNLITQLNKM
ncbi:hypothetical protein [Capnocytophaga canimorsus]|uniref:hypothetical protein n=1 Tax=Capnocytophaga canimorsus TaxID=28188 RepID=UPI0037D88484